MAAALRPHDLDWSRHAPAERGREFGPGLFLPIAVQRFGVALFESWSGGEPVCAGLPPHPGPSFPSAAEAFDGHGRPIIQVHEAHGAAVRAALSPAAWLDAQIRRRDERKWLATHVLDPETGRAIAPELLRAREGGDRADPINPDNWTEAWEEAVLMEAVRSSGVEIMERVADEICSLAAGGHIAIAPRRDGTDDAAPLPPAAWHVGRDVRLRRIATAAIGEGDPLHDGRERLLFVLPDGLDEAIERFCLPRRTPALDEATLVGPEFERRSPERRHLYAALDVRMEPHVRQWLTMPERREWRAPRFHRELETIFGALDFAVVKRLLVRLLAEPEHAALRGRGGRPRKGSQD